jgi:MFS family permease
VDTVRRNVVLLSFAQALLLVNNVVFITLNGLAGYMLAADKSLATLPVTGYVIGSALWAIPAAQFMRRYGRRAGFTFGSAMGIAGSGLCALAVYMHSFELLCIATIVAGAYNAFAIQYRFAAADVAAPEFRAKAIAIVLAGGIAGGILGPESAKLTKDMLSLPFVGSYLSLIVAGLVSIGILQFIRMPPQKTASAAAPRRPLSEIAAQPALVVAIVAAALSYGVMNLLMTATPLAMEHHQHAFSSAALVIEWHVIGMYAPGFFTGNLIGRFGVLRVMLAGAALNFCCVAIALNGDGVVHFWSALFLLGIGWNFLFVGATTLLTESYRPQEKALVQGINDACVFGTMAVSSFASGLLLHANGWTMLNRISLVPLAILTFALVWLAWVRRVRAPAVPA